MCMLDLWWVGACRCIAASTAERADTWRIVCGGGRRGGMVIM